MKILLTAILIQLVNISFICGQAKELNSDKILLFELDKSLRTKFIEDDSLAKLPFFSYLSQVYPGYDVEVAFNKTASNLMFLNSKNIIRVTSFWQKRFDPSIVCSLNGDYRTWQIVVQVELKKDDTNVNQYIIEEHLDINLVEKIIDIFEREPKIKRELRIRREPNTNSELNINNKVHNRICIDTSLFNSSPVIIRYFEKLKSEFGYSNIDFDN